MTEQNLGLRERKRIETRRELESATIELVMRDGLEQTTIEAISERANVSPRTFFNYFESKEDALLGIHVATVSDDQIVEHIEHHHTDDLIESIVDVMVSFIGPSLTDPTLYASRQQIIRQYPQLLERKLSRIADMTKQLSGIIPQIASVTSGQQISLAQAEVIASLCIGSVRVVVRESIASGKKLALPVLKKQARQIINEVIEKLNG